MKAIDIIHDEHRSLAAVLHGMLYLVRDIRLRGTEPKFDVLGAMVYYIDAFPERFHHPKEDAYLFRLLKLRYRDAAPLIEKKCGIPVVTGSHADHWEAFRTLGINDRIEGHGRLMASLSEIPAKSRNLLTAAVFPRTWRQPPLRSNGTPSS